MTTALVGHTGFVGGNLAAQRGYSVLINSSNGDDLAGEHFDTVVFSAAKAEKWRINQDPLADLTHIAELKRLLTTFTTDRLVLISTVDVFGDPVGVDESSEVLLEGLHPYGLHRFELERFAREHHESTSVVRLPGLFGPGLKKNVVYDLLNDNNVDRIHSGGSFQYYNLAHLAADLDIVTAADLPLVHLTSEPVTTREVAGAAFGFDFDNEPAGTTAGSYDIRSQYADRFGGIGLYTRSKAVTLAELAEYVATERAARAGTA